MGGRLEKKAKIAIKIKFNYKLYPQANKECKLVSWAWHIFFYCCYFFYFILK